MELYRRRRVALGVRRQTTADLFETEDLPLRSASKVASRQKDRNARSSEIARRSLRLTQVSLPIVNEIAYNERVRLEVGTVIAMVSSVIFLYRLK